MSDTGEVCDIKTHFYADKSWWLTYKPLLTIAAYILGGTVLIAVSSDNWQTMSLMSNFMGLFFIVFAFFKLLDVAGFARAFQSYDVIAKHWPAYGYIYPWIELFLGISFLINFWPLGTNLATLVIMVIGTVGVVSAVLMQRKIQCGCLGTVFELPMSTVTIIENLLMVVMAATSLVILW